MTHTLSLYWDKKSPRNPDTMNPTGVFISNPSDTMKIHINIGDCIKYGDDDTIYKVVNIGGDIKNTFPDSIFCNQLARNGNIKRITTEFKNDPDVLQDITVVNCPVKIGGKRKKSKSRYRKIKRNRQTRRQ